MKFLQIFTNNLVVKNLKMIILITKILKYNATLYRNCAYNNNNNRG